MKKLLLVLVAVLSACSSKSDHMSQATVRVTNLSASSGGTGVIVSNRPYASTILTNGHVCEVVKNGGLVTTFDNQSYAVVAYTPSKTHDLCLIDVASDLHVSASVSNRSPARLSPAKVSGHPSLLPNIITSGHFSDKVLIKVMIGSRPCTLEDANDEGLAFICSVLGTLPIIKNYESIVVSPSIQPGSSGSAVYNQNEEISALIFAGANDFGYGFAVPLEYIRHFLYTEIHQLTPQEPNMEINFSSASRRSNRQDITDRIQKLCSSLPANQHKTVCENFSDALKINDLLYNKKK